jgi:hypothetical protein
MINPILSSQSQNSNQILEASQELVNLKFQTPSHELIYPPSVIRSSLFKFSPILESSNPLCQISFKFNT